MAGTNAAGGYAYERLGTRAGSGGLPLGVLRRLASSLESVLLALLHPRVTREEPRLAQRDARAVGIRLQESTGDAVADGARLTVMTAALDLDHRVVAALRAGYPERHGDLSQVDGVAEM